MEQTKAYRVCTEENDHDEVLRGSHQELIARAAIEAVTGDEYAKPQDEYADEREEEINRLYTHPRMVLGEFWDLMTLAGPYIPRQRNTYDVEEEPKELALQIVLGRDDSGTRVAIITGDVRVPEGKGVITRPARYTDLQPESDAVLESARVRFQLLKPDVGTVSASDGAPPDDLCPQEIYSLLILLGGHLPQESDGAPDAERIETMRRAYEEYGLPAENTIYMLQQAIATPSLNTDLALRYIEIAAS